MFSASDLGRSINLLTPDNLAELLGWVPSHIRKFAENARHQKLDGWNESFGKEASYDALAALLILPGGADTAEAICRRAKIKCIREVAETKAKRILQGLQQGPELPPRESWPRLLAQSGELIDAAWILWCDHGQNLPATGNDWIAGYEEITALFEAPATGESSHLGVVSTNPTDQGGETFHRIRTDILAWLDAAESDTSELASRLREAADRVDQLLLSERQATHLVERRAKIRTELAQFQAATAVISGATTVEVARHLAELLASDEEWAITPIEQALERIPDYLTTASGWRFAWDRLSETHDYIGVKEAHDAEEKLAKEILSLLASSLTDRTHTSGPEPSSDEHPDPSAAETNPLSTVAENSSDQIATPTTIVDELVDKI